MTDAQRSTRTDEAAAGARPLRLLLIEDDADDARLVVGQLSRAGYDVAWERVDSAAALAAAIERQRWDLITCDWVMPGFAAPGGLSALRLLRRHGAVAPIVVVSGEVGRAMIVSAMKAGARDVVAKSELSELPAAVARELHDETPVREAPPAPPPVSGRSAPDGPPSDGDVDVLRAELAAVRQELATLVHSIAHDLRAPLRRIDGFCQLLIEDHDHQLDDEGRQYLSRIQHGAQAMDRLIRALLGLSRATSQPLSRAAVSLSTLAGEIAAALRQRDPQRRVDVAVAGDLAVEGDPTLLRTALEHLLDNAWKFTSLHPTARIEVGAEMRDGERVHFVRDDGAGFDMAHAAALFVPFRRLHTESAFDGAGVGLATVHRIVARHGGRIWAEAAPEQGAAFYFTLPPLRRPALERARRA